MAYVIKESDGTIINPGVKGDLAWLQETFAGKVIEEITVTSAPTEEQIAANFLIMERLWRDSELERTDTLHLVDDFPKKSELTTYRAALRAWPSTSDFPATRPVMG